LAFFVELGLFIPTYTWKAIAATIPKNKKIIDPMINPDYLDIPKLLIKILSINLFDYFSKSP
jgi:hypothetical protein